MRPLSAREQRLTAVALALGAAVVLWLGLVHPLIAGFSARAAQRTALAAEWRRDSGLIGAAPAWRRAAHIQALDRGAFRLPAASEGAAVETLKDTLQRLAADEDFQISAVTDLPGAAPPGFVRLRADMQLSLPQLVQSLRRLETEDPYVVVEYLSVSADRALASGRLGALDARVEISAPFGVDGAADADTGAALDR